MATANAIETLLNEFDVARFTGLSVASVRRWRLLRQGPKYLKIGAAVRYQPEHQWRTTMVHSKGFFPPPAWAAVHRPSH